MSQSSKFKALAVDFLPYTSFQCPPIATGGSSLEEVKSFKFHGVLVPHHLKWEAQCDSIVKKANHHFYAESSDQHLSTLD